MYVPEEVIKRKTQSRPVLYGWMKFRDILDFPEKIISA